MDNNIGNLSIYFKANDEMLQKAINDIIKSVSKMQTEINDNMAKPMEQATKQMDGITKATSKIKSGLKNVSTSAKETSKSLLNIGKNGVSALGSVLTKLASFAKIGTIVALAKKFGDLGGKVLELGSDMAEVENLFQVSFGNMSSEADAFAQRLNAAWGVDTTSVKEQTAYLNQMLTSMHFGSQTAYTMSTELEKLSYNMSSLYNISQQDAFEKLKSGIAGQSRPLTFRGIIKKFIVKKIVNIQMYGVRLAYI